ncbi:MAG: hypothetical protein GW798_00905 [Roseovarius sp.]|nr:hypothetical protein [Roseovarius sp.]
MRLTFEEVNQIVSLIDKSTCEELMNEADDPRLVVRKNSQSAPAPDKPAFVEAGSLVAKAIRCA